MNKTKYLLRNIGILTMSNFASKILVFLLIPLYTSVLTTEEFGSYDLAVSTATLFFPILTLNILDGVVRFALDKEIKNKKISCVGIKHIILGCVLFSFIIGIISFGNITVFAKLKGLEVYIIFYYISYALNQFFIQFAKGIERVKELGIAGTISTVIMVLTNIIFLVVLKLALPGFFLATIISQIASSMYIAFKIHFSKYVCNYNIDKELEKDMLVYSIPLVATTLGWWVNSTADKYAVAFMVGLSANGILSVAYKIPQMLNSLQTIFIQAWQISAVKEYSEKDSAAFYGSIFTSINLLMCLSGSVLIILTKDLAAFLFAHEFYEAWRYVPFLLISSVFNCASGLLGPILSAQKNSKAMMWSAIVGAFVNIVMNITLIYTMSIQGATIATMISSLVIYIVRRIAVGNQILLKNQILILITWVLLIIQAIVKIWISSNLIELIIIVLIFALNFKNIRIIFFKALDMIKYFRRQ